MENLPMIDPHVRLFSFTLRGGVYHSIEVDVGQRRIEVTTSPTGRSIHVWVDRVKWGPIPEEVQP